MTTQHTHSEDVDRLKNQGHPCHNSEKTSDASLPPDYLDKKHGFKYHHQGWNHAAEKCERFREKKANGQRLSLYERFHLRYWKHGLHTTTRTEGYEGALIKLESVNRDILSIVNQRAHTASLAGRVYDEDNDEELKKLRTKKRVLEWEMQCSDRMSGLWKPSPRA